MDLARSARAKPVPNEIETDRHVREDRGAWRLVDAPIAQTGPVAGAACILAVILAPMLGGRRVASDDELHRRGPDARDRAAEVAEPRPRSRRVAVARGRGWGRNCRPGRCPCPVRVKITRGEAGGITNFGFAGGRVTDQEISVEGRIDRILASGLPHEVTHTVFAAYFGGPMPRWADEGASLLSEDTVEHRRHDRIVDDTLARRGEMPLSRLFRVEDYPRDLMGFYGQGYSVSRFLVEMGGRPRFLQFVRDGMARGWDSASRDHYGLDDVRELDRAWRSWHKVNGEAVAARGEDGGAVVARAGGGGR